ncbi:MAG: TonB-dependent receptor [Desulfovibrionaceae bacterium]|nr:TonB-dependent receptor [Desulfovibrionaceae bacterium]
MKRFFLSFVSLMLCFLAHLGLTGNAHAEGFSLTDYGARGTALAGGLVARADDPSAVAINPAGITQLPGTQMLLGTTLISPSGTIKNNVGGTSIRTDVERHNWVNPHLHVTHQLNDRFWLGVGFFSRFGLGNSYPDEWPGKVNLQAVHLKTFSFNPNIAWKATENLSLAAGVELMYATMEMKKCSPYLNMSAMSLDYNQQKIKGTSIAPAFNLAMHYKFSDQWKAGLTYRSGARLKVDAKSYFEHQTNPIALPGVVIPAYRDSDASGTLVLPDIIAAAVAWYPTDRLSLEFGASYTVWSQFRHFNVHLKSPMNYYSQTDKNWKDTWSFNVSAEYKATDWLDLRCGYIYETSCMNMSSPDYMTPSNGRHRITTGVGLHYGNWSLDLAYAYLIIRQLNYDEAARTHASSGIIPGHSENGRSHIVATSLSYRF